MKTTAVITREKSAHRLGWRWVYNSDVTVDTHRFDGSPVTLQIGGNYSLVNLKNVLRRYGVTTFVLAWEAK